MKSIAEALLSHQGQHHFTQHQMAQLLHISQATYNNWVNNKTPIDPKYYPIIAKLCKIDVKEFIPPKAVLQIKGLVSENGESVQVNAMELYQKFMQQLEEHNMVLKEQIAHYKQVLKQKEDIIENQTAEIEKLKVMRTTDFKGK